MGGGGSSTNIDPRSFAQEKGTLKSGYGFQENQLNKFIAQSPLFSTSQGGALNFWNQLFGPGSGISQGYQNYIAPVIASGGALTPEGERDVSQATRTIEEQAGTAHTTGAIGRELLNRDSAKTARLGQYLGLAGQTQGLQTGALNQLNQTALSAISGFGATTNPILGYLSNLFTGNQQAQIEQAKIGAYENAQMKSGTSDVLGGVLSAVGKVAGAAAMASDERLKQKIRDTGVKTAEGVPLKTFEYKTKPGTVFLGVLAKDVERKMPSAVREDPISGIKLVDATRFPIFQISATRKAA